MLSTVLEACSDSPFHIQPLGGTRATFALHMFVLTAVQKSEGDCELYHPPVKPLRRDWVCPIRRMCLDYLRPLDTYASYPRLGASHRSAVDTGQPLRFA